MVASDGGVFTFGDAQFEGSCPGIGGCSGAAVAVVPDAAGNGYWLVTATGNVYAFGDASSGGQNPFNAPVVSAARTGGGTGFEILLSNGAVFPQGDAEFYGSCSAPSGCSGEPTAILAEANGGYWIATATGNVYAFGDAPNDGGMGGQHLNGSIIAGVGF
jgi:hypothetical protein